MKNLEEIKAILGQVKSLVKEKYHVSELSKNGLKGRRRERILSEVIYV